MKVRNVGKSRMMRAMHCIGSPSWWRQVIRASIDHDLAIIADREARRIMSQWADAGATVAKPTIADFTEAARLMDAKQVQPRGRMLWDGQKMHRGPQ